MAIARARGPQIKGASKGHQRAACDHITPCGCTTADKKIDGISCCLKCPFTMCVFDNPTAFPVDGYGNVNRKK